MDFRFLLDPRRKLLSLGFDVETGKHPAACYDLLASEARIAVFAAIAKEDIPQDVWFQLGRSHTREHGIPVLLSWTGTMFEYLMPVLWMRTYPNTLLDNSRIAAVRLQQIYAGEKGVPWGISESAYAKSDEAGTISTRLSVFLRFHCAMANRKRWSSRRIPLSWLLMSIPAKRCVTCAAWPPMDGLALTDSMKSADYSSTGRHSWRHRHELVRCWMVHHQGMSLLAHGELPARWSRATLVS